MLNLGQVKVLEEKVAKAVHLVQMLKEENAALRAEIDGRGKRITELEQLVLAFQDDQTKIEEGILKALNHLSTFEDSAYGEALTQHAAKVLENREHAGLSEELTIRTQMEIF